MTPAHLLKVSITVPAEAEEVVASLFESILRQPLALSTDADTLRTEISAFFASASGFSESRKRRLAGGLDRLRRAGVPVGRAHLRHRILPARDWAESWKRHFKPLEIGSRLLIKPSWSRRRARVGQAEVVLDPGLSFGTGQHPTTAFCLAQVVAGRPRAGRTASLWDVGTGSGILAIAAAKLGYERVEAFDYDPAAVRIARENARLNGVHRQIKLQRRDLTKMDANTEEPFSVVCANLLAPLLLAERDRLGDRLQPGGRLILAGILATEFPQVRAHYEAVGWRLLSSRTVREWRSGAFTRP